MQPINILSKMLLISLMALALQGCKPELQSPAAQKNQNIPTSRFCEQDINADNLYVRFHVIEGNYDQIGLELTVTISNQTDRVIYLPYEYVTAWCADEKIRTYDDMGIGNRFLDFDIIQKDLYQDANDKGTQFKHTFPLPSREQLEANLIPLEPKAYFIFILNTYGYDGVLGYSHKGIHRNITAKHRGFPWVQCNIQIDENSNIKEIDADAE